MNASNIQNINTGPINQNQNLNDSFTEKETPQETTPPPSGILGRIQGCFAGIRNKFQCPTPDLSFFKQHLNSAWETFQHIEWRQQINAIKEHQWVVLISGSFSGDGASNFALFDDIMKVVSNSLSAVKRFFANYSLIQKVFQSPKLLSGLSFGYCIYNLYFSIQHCLEKCGDYDEKVYRCLDLIEHFGSLFDNASSFILGLEEASFISSRLAALVPPLTAVSIALSMTSQVPKAFLWAKLKREIAILESNELINGRESYFQNRIMEHAGKENMTSKSDNSNEDQLIRKKLQRIQSIEPTLLNRLFALKNSGNESSSIQDSIQSIRRTQANENRNDSIGRRKDLLDTLKGRMKTRSDSLLTSLKTTIISAIGLGLLVFTRLTILAHLTLLLTTIFAIIYMRNERTYALKFEESLKLVQKKETPKE